MFWGVGAEHGGRGKDQENIAQDQCLGQIRCSDDCFASLMHIYSPLVGEGCLHSLCWELLQLNHWFYRNGIGREAIKIIRTVEVLIPESIRHWWLI